MNEKTYKWDSADYARHSASQYQWARELIAKLNLKGTETVLDIGCGDGKVTAFLASQLPEGDVTGIDNSEDMILLAKQRFQKSEYHNLSFQLMDATALRFENQFDAIFSNASIHWIQDQLALLRGVKRSLKNSGRLLFQMGGKGNAKDLSDILDELINKKPWKPFFKNFSSSHKFCSSEEYERYMKQAGLTPKRLELIPKDMQHEGKEGLASWIRTTWLPYTQRVPPHLRDQFINKAVDAYSKRFPVDNHGYIHVKMVRLEVEGVNL